MNEVEARASAVLRRYRTERKFAWLFAAAVVIAVLLVQCLSARLESRRVAPTGNAPDTTRAQTGRTP